MPPPEKGQRLGLLRCVLLQTEMLWERSQDGATGSGVGKDSKGQRKLKDWWRRFASFSARTAKDRES